MKSAAKVLIRDDQGRILVLYRSQTHPQLANDIDLPGGEIELDESIENGLVREVVEETGLEVRINSNDLTHSWRSLFGEQQILYETQISTEEEVVISWEHDAYEWVSDEEFIAFGAQDEFMHKVQDWLGKGDRSSSVSSQLA